MKTFLSLTLILVQICYPAIRLMAQDNYEIQVYASELTEKNHTVFEIHSNYTLGGTTQMQDGIYPSNHAIHETVEITRGFSNWLEIGSYLFTSIGSENRTALTGVHLRPRISIPEDYNLPVGLSLGAEIGYQNPSFFGSRWGVEVRPILDKQFNKFYVALNLPVGLSLDKNQDHELEFSPSAKTSFEVSEKVNLGLEYYTSLGAIRNLDPVVNQRHQLFGAIDWDFDPDWEFNAGIGYGLTPNSDKWVFKLILGWRLRDKHMR